MTSIRNRASGLGGFEIGLLIAVVIVLVVAVFLLNAALLQLAWNHGVVHAFGSHAISFATAFYLTLGVATVGTVAKGFNVNASSD